MIDQARLARIEPQRGALAGDKAEGSLGMSERKPLDDIGYGGGLDPLRFHEFEPRRCRIEEIAHLDPCAGSKGSRLEPRLSSAINFDSKGFRRTGGTALNREPRDRANRRQSLTAEAERHDAREIVASELRGCVALDGKREIIGRHARAVISDADQPKSA